MNKKKIAVIAGSTVGAGALLISGALALFTARADSDFSAKAGTVQIEVDKLGLTNEKNINPGDNDPSNPEGATAGTPHKFTYDVENMGNKSVRTRHTIILTADKAGDSKELLDARFFAMYAKGKEVEGKVYVLENGDEKTTITEEDNVKAVKYVFLSNVMDGKGEDVTKGGDAEKESGDNVVKQSGDSVKKTYDYDFVMLRTATNTYQGCDVQIEVLVEALQYRNTDNKDWDEAGIVVRKYSNADVKSEVVPAADEDKDGNPIKK